MSVKDQKVDPESGFAVQEIIFQVDAVPASQSNVEFRSVRLPTVTDWELVSAHMHCRAVSGTVQVFLQDDGVGVTGAASIVAGVQTAMALTSPPVKILGGSEFQLIVNSGAGESIDDMTVTAYLRPLYTYGRQAIGVPS